MVPCAAQRMARASGWDPLASNVVVDIPRVAACESALMPPNEGVPADELVDVELKRLGDTCIGDPEINVIGEVVECGYERMAGVGQPLRTKIPHHVIVAGDGDRRAAA